MFIGCLALMWSIVGFGADNECSRTAVKNSYAKEKAAEMCENVSDTCFKSLNMGGSKVFEPARDCKSVDDECFKEKTIALGFSDKAAIEKCKK